MKKTIFMSVLCTVFALTSFFGAAQAASTETEGASLFKRLGGHGAIVAVVNDLVPRLAGDKQLGRFWEHRGNDGIEREKQLIIDFIANQAGGNHYYTGRKMKLSHVGMRISNSDWGVFMKHLNATLDTFKLPAKERQDVISFMKSTKDDIVE